MRCVAVNARERRVALRDWPEPRRTRPGQLALASVEVGICGTDEHVLGFRYGRPPADDDWLILGHEALLRVVEPAREDGGQPALAEGQLCVPLVRRPCVRPDCRPCRNGRQDFCRSGEFRERGIAGAHGFLAERVIDEPRYLVPVPDALAPVGVLTEPLSIVEKALEEALWLQRRLPWGCGNGPAECRALVLGAGPIGLLGLAKLRELGFPTAVYSRGPADGARAEWVRALGGRYVSAGEVEARELARHVGLADLVLEATGAPKLSFEVLGHALATNGVYVFTGIPGRRAPAELAIGRVMRALVLENQLVLGAVNAERRHYELAVRDLAVLEARFPGGLAQLIAARLPLERWQDATQRAEGEVKRVVRLAGAE